MKNVSFTMHKKEGNFKQMSTLMQRSFKKLSAFYIKRRMIDNYNTAAWK